MGRKRSKVKAKGKKGSNAKNAPVNQSTPKETEAPATTATIHAASATGTVPSPIADFANAESFPAFRDLPPNLGIDPNYYSISARDLVFRPTRHWALLASIQEVSSLFATSILQVRDSRGKSFRVILEPHEMAGPMPPGYKWNEFRVGDALVVFYPLASRFWDGEEGVLCEVMSHVKTFPHKLENLIRLNQDVLRFGPKSDQPQCCHACHKSGGKKQLCSRCRLFAYCDKHCQTLAWEKLNHKKECKILGDLDLKAMLQLDYGQFDGFFVFPSWALRFI